MIPQNQVEEIRRLLAEGKHSQRQIATLTGVSRGTIGAVASGKRTDRLPQPTDEWDEARGPLIRCPGCGGRVFSPCRLCRVRDFKTAEHTDRRQTADREAKADPRHNPLHRPPFCGETPRRN